MGIHGQTVPIWASLSVLFWFCKCDACRTVWAMQSNRMSSLSEAPWLNRSACAGADVTQAHGRKNPKRQRWVLVSGCQECVAMCCCWRCAMLRWQQHVVSCWIIFSRHIFHFWIQNCFLSLLLLDAFLPLRALSHSPSIHWQHSWGHTGKFQCADASVWLSRIFLCKRVDSLWDNDDLGCI